MNALLLTAMNRENPNPNIPEGRTTRSSGIQLEWNPIMNSKDTVLQKQMDITVNIQLVIIRKGSSNIIIIIFVHRL